jgi:2-polyprenyl-6-methoxyphenol hydroxylase-like FAD-dependent oxidoreductase
MTTNTQHDVIIAGAGPIGLFLACELSMRNVSVIVLERDADSSNPWLDTSASNIVRSIH